MAPTWPATKVVMLGRLPAQDRIIQNPKITPRPQIDYLPPYTTPIPGQNTIRQIAMNGVRNGVGGLLGLGAAGEQAAASPDCPNGWKVAYGMLVTASGALSMYHGYRRNNSLGWGLGWFALGTLFPVITPTVAFAQGFGKRKGR